MAKLLKKKSGFTLIELMIVVAILGILAALAIPAFVGYIRRSKTSEATGMLNSMYKAAASYYSQERTGRSLTASTSTHCVVASEALNPSTPGSDKVQYVLTPGGGAEALGFSVADYVYYGYGISSVAGCNSSPNTDGIYTFIAQGDLDGDGTRSTFELAVGSDEENTLYHARGFYIVDETE